VEEPARTLIVTSELAGLHKNGGIGTAFSELAAALAGGSEIRVAVLVAHEAVSFPVKQREAVEAR
jgi:glycogen synthase